MTKKEIIAALMAANSELDEKELKKMKVDELAAMLPQGDDKVPEDVKDVEPETEAPVEEKKVEEFITFCGSPFDPAQSSDCFLECQNATPEQYERCVEHFKANPPVKAATKAKADKAKATNKRGKNRWGHLVNSQAELIDRALIEAPGPVTLDKIAEFAEAKKPRTRHHLMHLRNDWKVALYITPEKGIFLGERFPDMVNNEGVVEFT